MGCVWGITVLRVTGGFGFLGGFGVFGVLVALLGNLGTWGCFRCDFRGFSVAGLHVA